MILVFAGAGASKAVSPDQYPTTVEFFERLPEGVTSLPLFGAITEFLGAHHPEEPLDIEQVLWAIGEWKELHSLVSDTGEFPGWLLTQRRIRKALGKEERFNPRQAIQKIAAVNKGSVDLESRINQRVYSLYRRLPEDEELAETWAPFLTHALDIDSRVDVFTTNYDLILEAVIESKGFPIETGRAQGVTSNLRMDLWDEARVDPRVRKTGLLTKLHGSLDWIRGEGETEIFVGTPQFTGEHQRHAIIYPGFKGRPQTTPFTFFHDYFRGAIEHAEAAVFIGFAFRDDAIRDIVADRLPSGIPVVVIGYGEPPPRMPFRKGQHKYLADGFSTKTAEAGLKWIEKAVQ